MTKRKSIFTFIVIVLLLLFWLWPRTAMPDMKGMENIAITVIETDIMHGVPQSKSRQYSIKVGSPAYTELETLLENTYVHRSLQELWSDGVFKGGDHTIMLLSGEAMIFSDGVIQISNHLYSGFRPNTGAYLSAQITALLSDEPLLHP